jgi:hypothetical protein
MIATPRSGLSRSDLVRWHTSSLATSQVDTSVDEGGGDQTIKAWQAKLPEQLELRTELPMTATRKVIKGHLKPQSPTV